MSDLQLRTDDNELRLLRKDGDRYRVVTSQTDWTTYNGDPSGNRYTKLTQIDQSNVARLAPKWIFPMPNVPQVENTPLVVEGVMYVSSANECYALDAGSGRMIWHYQRPRTKGLAGNAAIGFNRGVAWSGRSHLHADRQRAHDRAEPLQRRAALGNRDGRLASELQRHLRAARRRQSGHLRHRGRR